MHLYPWVGRTNRGHAQIHQARGCRADQHHLVFQRVGRQAAVQDIGCRNVFERAAFGAAPPSKRHQTACAVVHGQGHSVGALANHDALQPLVTLGQKARWWEPRLYSGLTQQRPKHGQ